MDRTETTIDSKSRTHPLVPAGIQLRFRQDLCIGAPGREVVLDVVHLHLARQPVSEHAADVCVRRLIHTTGEREHRQLDALGERLQQFLRHDGVLDRIVQQGGTLRGRVMGPLVHSPCNLDRMLGIRAPGAVEVAAMPGLTKQQRVFHELLPWVIVVERRLPAGAGIIGEHTERGKATWPLPVPCSACQCRAAIVSDSQHTPGPYPSAVLRSFYLFGHGAFAPGRARTDGQKTGDPVFQT